MEAYRRAISSIESGSPEGRYDLLGPVTRTGDRAHGRYQVMGANIGPWTQEALGRAYTPQEFLADTKAQDAVFDTKFGQSVAKYGNPQDAASVWFSGRPIARAGNAADVLGTTVPVYVSKFTNNLNGQPGTAPMANPGAQNPTFQTPVGPPRVSEDTVADAFGGMVPSAELPILTPPTKSAQIDGAMPARDETDGIVAAFQPRTTRRKPSATAKHSV